MTFMDHSEVIYLYYGNVRAVDKMVPKKGDGNFDVLLLGGSVLNPNNGEVAEKLKLQLKELDSSRSFKIHNVSYSGHTSRDSKFKMELLSKYHFDLVVFYHGINEVRANNCPNEVFKVDYGHFVWYDEINRVKKYSGHEISAIPLAFDYYKVIFTNMFFPTNYIPEGNPREGWREFGNNIKTEESFRSNLLDIKNIVNDMGSKLIVPTFTYCVDSNYSLQEFEKRRFRDERVRFPIETWGFPSNVTKGIEAHNGIIKELTNEEGIVVIEMDSEMSKNDIMFDDVCHLTERGSGEFSKRIVKEIDVILNGSNNVND